MGRFRCGAKFTRQSGVELDAQAIGFGGGMTEAVVTDGAQSARQHVTQITRHELNAGDRGNLTPVIFGPVLPAERDRLIGDVDEFALFTLNPRGAIDLFAVV